MIFATVGTQLPFPRLIDALEDIAKRRDLRILAQTCDAGRQSDVLTLRSKMPPDEFADAFQSAPFIIAHAGIGTVLSARRYRKPLIILARRADLGEHRNDHQLATAAQMRERPGIYVAGNGDSLEDLIVNSGSLKPPSAEGSASKRLLVDCIRTFITQ
ncbi:MAG: glucuronosyltransferase [Pseudomonadota bacterium]